MRKIVQQELADLHVRHARILHFELWNAAKHVANLLLPPHVEFVELLLELGGDLALKAGKHAG